MPILTTVAGTDSQWSCVGPEPIGAPDQGARVAQSISEYDGQI